MSGLFKAGPQDLIPVSGDSNSVMVKLADLNGDGALDAFVVNNLQGDLVWLNDGLGTFMDSGQSLGGAAPGSDVALADLNRDRRIDAFVVNNGAPDTVWFNDGAGNFTDSGQILGALLSCGYGGRPR